MSPIHFGILMYRCRRDVGVVVAMEVCFDAISGRQHGRWRRLSLKTTFGAVPGKGGGEGGGGRGGGREEAVGDLELLGPCGVALSRPNIQHPSPLSDSGLSASQPRYARTLPFSPGSIRSPSTISRSMPQGHRREGNRLHRSCSAVPASTRHRAPRPAALGLCDQLAN